MTRGKLIGVGLVGLIALALGAGPRLAATFTQDRYQQLAEESEAQLAASGYQASVEVTEYRSGWFESRATTRTTVDTGAMLPAEAKLPETLVIESHDIIHHGPLAFGGACGTRLGAATVHSRVTLPGYAEALAKAFPDGHVASGCARIGFGGGLTGDLRIPGYEGPVGTAALDAAWDPVTISYTVENDAIEAPYAPGLTLQLILTDISAPRLTLRDAGNEITITDMTLDVVQDIEAAKTVVSTFEARVASLSGRFAASDDTPGGAVQLDGLEMSSNATLSGKLGEGDLSMKVDAGRLDDTRIGESRFNLAFKRLDVAAMYTYAQELRDLQQAGLEPEQLDARMPGLLMDVAPRILSSSPAMDFELSSKRPDGADVRLSGKAGFDGEGEFRLLNLQDMLGRTRLSTELHLPEPMVRTLMRDFTEQQIRAALAQQQATASDERIGQAAQQQAQRTLQIYEQQGYIERTDGAYQTTFRLEGGQMTLNGRPLSGMAQGM